ncbi:MAG: nicotinamide-nucleotide amidohydrolase family protein [Pseudomonadota bacterium]
MTAKEIVHAYSSAGLKLTTAESCTGGMIAAAVTDIPGSSSVFERGFVTYSNTAKTEMISVPAPLFESVGAVSVEVAKAMAEGALDAAKADVAVSVTGIAGPGGSEFKPEGRVCFGLSRAGYPTRVEQIDFGALGRDRVRRASVDYALELLAAALP